MPEQMLGHFSGDLSGYSGQTVDPTGVREKTDGLGEEEEGF